MESRYTKESTDQSTRFTVLPASVNKVKGGEPWMIAGLLAFIIIGTTSGDTGTFGWIVRWVLAIGAGWLGYKGMIMFIMRKAAATRSAGGDFIVSRMGILTSPKQTIIREDIQELQVRNTFPKAKDVSFALGVLDKQGRFTILGGGMEADVAGNLMTDAMRVIGGMKEIA